MNSLTKQCGHFDNVSTCWLNHPSENICASQIKLDHFPKDRGAKKNKLKPPPRSCLAKDVLHVLSQDGGEFDGDESHGT